MLPVAIIAYRQYISLNKQVIPMEISIYIGVTIREIRHTHLVMHTFLQRGACQVLFIVTGINTIKCTAYIEPMREAIKQR